MILKEVAQPICARERERERALVRATRREIGEACERESANVCDEEGDSSSVPPPPASRISTNSGEFPGPKANSETM